MRQHRAGGQNGVLSPATPSSGRLMSTIIDTFVAPPCREQITLLYQDEHLLLINKPAGLLSLSGKDPRNLTPCITGWFSAFRAAPWCTAWTSVPPV